MKQIRFWGQPIGDTELTTTISDEVWETLQQKIDSGSTANDIFQEIWNDYSFEVGLTRLVGRYEVFVIRVVGIRGDLDVFEFIPVFVEDTHMQPDVPFLGCP